MQNPPRNSVEHLGQIAFAALAKAAFFLLSALAILLVFGVRIAASVRRFLDFATLAGDGELFDFD